MDGSGTFELYSNETTAGTASWSGCTPSGGDHYIVPDGFTLTLSDIDADEQIEFIMDGDAGNTGTGLEIQSGGSLVVQGRATIDLNDEMLDCEVGSSCTLNGHFREWDRTDGTPSPTTDLPTVDVNGFQVGRIVLCENGDCATNANLVCFEYDDNVWVNPPSAESVDYHLDDAIADFEVSTDLDATEDYIVFWDWDTTDRFTGADYGFAYPIHSKNSSTDPYDFCFNVRQGDDTPRLSTIATRDIQQGAITADFSVGDGCGSVIVPAAGTVSEKCNGTYIRVDTGIITTDNAYEGRWIRFDDTNDGSADATARQRAYHIAQTIDCDGAPAAPDVCGGSANDIVVISDPRGVVHGQTSGDRFWIDYGWKSGDPFFVMAPVNITQTAIGTTVETDLIDLSSSTLDVTGVVFSEGNGTKTTTNNNSSNVTVNLGGNDGNTQITAWQHVIVRNDKANVPRNSGKAFNVNRLIGQTLNHTVLSAGLTTHGFTTWFGNADDVSMEACNAVSYTWNDTFTRYLDDGPLVGPYPAAECCDGTAGECTGATWGPDDVPEPTITYNRGHYQFTGNNWNQTESESCDPCNETGSANLVAFQGTSMENLTIKDILCTRCTFDAGSAVGNDPGNPSGLTLNSVDMGYVSGQSVPGASREDNSFFIHISSNGGANWFTGESSNVVLQNPEMLSVNSSTIISGVSVSAAYILDAAASNTTGLNITADNNDTVSNIAVVNFHWLDSDCAAKNENCTLFQTIDASTTGALFEKFLLYWPDGVETDSYRLFRTRTSDTGPGVTIKDILMVNYAFSGADPQPFNITNGQHNDSDCSLGNICIENLMFFNNEETIVTLSETPDPGPVDYSIDPRFADADRYDLTITNPDVTAGYDQANPPGLKRNSLPAQIIGIPWQEFSVSPSYWYNKSGAGGGGLGGPSVHGPRLH